MKETITEHLAGIVPHGEKCYGCPKAEPRGIDGYSGDVFCHLMEEVMVNGNKGCAINDPRWSEGRDLDAIRQECSPPMDD